MQQALQNSAALFEANHICPNLVPSYTLRLFHPWIAAHMFYHQRGIDSM